MRDGLCLLALRTILFLSLVVAVSPSYASVDVDGKARGLAHYIVGLCHEINGETDQAISEYQASVTYNGEESAPRLKLGAYFLRLNKMDQALLQLKAAERLDAQDAQTHYLLALIYSAAHQYDQAAAEYEMILKTASKDDPANTEAYMYLGQLYYAQAKYPQAIVEFTKVIRLDPANTTALDLLGSVYADEDDHPKAIGIFRQVLQLQGQDTEALNSLGYIYAEDGVHLDEALRMIRQAIQIDPSNGAYYDSLGWALYKKGSLAESLIALQKAGTFIEDEILYDHMGDVYNALKQYAEARTFWQKSLDLDPHQTQVEQKIKKLEKCIASRSTHQLN